MDKEHPTPKTRQELKPQNKKSKNIYNQKTIRQYETLIENKKNALIKKNDLKK
jgi:hypothetical protein